MGREAPDPENREHREANPVVEQDPTVEADDASPEQPGPGDSDATTPPRPDEPPSPSPSPETEAGGSAAIAAADARTGIDDVDDEDGIGGAATE